MSDFELTVQLDTGAKAVMAFAFEGDWRLVYDDAPETEDEARSWFVREVQLALEHAKSHGNEAAGETPAADRGA